MSDRRPIFALACYSVEERRDGYYYGLTTHDARRDYQGPFRSPQAVCLAISHQLTREIIRRQKRLERARQEDEHACPA